VTSRFPIRQVNDLRQRAAAALHVGDCPEAHSGWALADFCFDAFLRVSPWLRLKEGYRLVGYLCGYADRKGAVWAVRSDADVSTPACDMSDFNSVVRKYPNRAPRPPGALDQFMLAFAGDGTAWSYLCASLLARGLADFGARWHDIRWAHETIVGDDLPGAGRQPSPLIKNHDGSAMPPRDGHEERGISRWLEPKPEVLEPVFSIVDRHPTIILHTYSEWGQCRVDRLTDRFDPGAYTFETHRVTIAEGRHGYMV
jgi:hypothetical protein